MTVERAQELHDKAWASYYKLSMKARHDKSFKVQQGFLEASQKVALAQERLNDIEGRFSGFRR